MKSTTPLEEKMPPPPPPPGPPPPPSGGPPRPPAFKSPTKSKGGGTADRGDLLKSIQQGKALKKAVTNDRSAPLVGGKSANNNNNAVNANNNRTGGSASTQGILLKDIYNKTVR